MKKWTFLLVAVMFLFCSGVARATVNVVDSAIENAIDGEGITFTGTSLGTANVAHTDDIGIIAGSTSVTTEVNGAGTMNFAGSSTVSGTIGGVGAYLDTINVTADGDDGGDFGYFVTFDDDVYVNTLNFIESTDSVFFTEIVFDGDAFIGQGGAGDGITTVSNDFGIINFRGDTIINGAIGGEGANIHEIDLISANTTLTLNDDVFISNFVDGSGGGLWFTNDDQTMVVANGVNINTDILAIPTLEDTVLTFSGSANVDGRIGLLGGAIPLIEVGAGTVGVSGEVFATDVTIGAGNLQLSSNSEIADTSVDTGYLTLLSAADLTGDVAFIGDGTVALSSTSNVTGNVTTDLDGQGNITTNGASLLTGTVGGAGVNERIGSIDLGAAGTTRITGAVYATDVSMAAGSTLQLEGASNNITNTTIGTGGLTLASAADLTGTVAFLSDGLFALSNNSNFTGDVGTSGVDNVGNITTFGTVLITGQVGAAGAGNRIGSLNISGAGTTEISGAVYATDASIGAGTLQLDTNSNITSTGIGAGSLVLDSATLTGAVAFTGDGTLALNGGSNLTGNITTTGGANVGNITTNGVTTITGTVGATGAGRIGSINVSGAGQTLITQAVYATDATVGAGTLQLNVASSITNTSIGAGMVSLATGADLGGNVNFTDDGTLRLSNGSNVIGDITTDNDNDGTLDVLGASIIDGAVGGSGEFVKLIQVTNDGDEVTFSDEVNTYALEFGVEDDGGDSDLVFDGVTRIGFEGNGGVTTLADDLGIMTFNDNAFLEAAVGTGAAELYEMNVNGGTTTIYYAMHVEDIRVTGATLQLAAAFQANGGLIDGDLSIGNDGVLDLGLNTLTLTDNDTWGNGEYAQGEGSTLRLTMNDVIFGHIVSELASVSADSTIDVVSDPGVDVELGDIFTIVDVGTLADADLSAMTIIDDILALDFAASIVGGDLVLTAVEADNASYVPLENPTPNETGVGQALDGITAPGADMSDVLGELDALQGDQQAYKEAVDDLDPDVNGGVAAGMFNTMSLASGIYTTHMDNIRSGISTGETGFAFGDKEQPKTFWAKAFGSYMKQGVVAAIDGYDAKTAGTMLGVDWLATQEARVGFGAGWSNTAINNKVNAGGTSANSYQGAVYGSYQAESSPYYVDGVLTAAFNQYNGKREISFGGIDRQAKSDYDGQQYSALISGGYNYEVKGGVVLTPLWSVQYAHLDIDKYTETGAGALDLSVAKQRYDFLQSGLGFKVARPFTLSSGTLIPEFHVKWLYDFIGDKAQTTASFAGGGALFATAGAEPEQSSFDLGLGLSLISTKDWSLIANYDYEIKDAFFSHTGSVAVKLAF